MPNYRTYYLSFFRTIIYFVIVVRTKYTAPANYVAFL